MAFLPPPDESEEELRQRMQTWHDPKIIAAARDVAEASDPGETPMLDLGPYMRGEAGALEKVAHELQQACESSGFFFIRNHGVSQELVDRTFAATKAFHEQPLEAKMAVVMNELGVGYMPLNQRKLPTREKGNLNEAFFVKRELGPRNITLERNQWPASLPGFRETCIEYADAMERLAKQLLPLFAVALNLPSDYFDEGFTRPLYRLRLSHYPGSDEVQSEDGQFGIAPHVDTTFLTILASTTPGLAYQCGGRWVAAPSIPGAFLVNTGELLKRWSNDRFVAVLHCATHVGSGSRYSIPFFFNADADYRMVCLPTCWGHGNPPKYPSVSYLESEGVKQGE